MLRLVVITFVYSVVAVGCDSQRNAKQLQLLIASLKNANSFIEESNGLYMLGFAEKAKDPYSFHSAQPLLAKAQSILQHANRARLYIDDLKKEIADKNITIPEQIFDTVLACRLAMLQSIEPRNEFQSALSFNEFKESEKKAIDSFVKNWSENYFFKSNNLMDQVMLSKLENDLLLTANSLIKFCYGSIHTRTSCFAYFPMASISSNCVKPGEIIEVSGGVGAFDGSMHPKVIIDGVPVALREDALAIHTVTAKRKPGKYEIPFSIEYSRVDGARIQVHKKLVYTVTE